MNKTLKIVLLVIVGLLVVAVPSVFWYRAHYSMAMAKAFEVGAPSSPQRILIATQGSAYKDALVAGIIEHLKPRAAYIKVIDVSALSSVQEKDWTAIVVLHTWESWKPQPDAKAFVANIKQPKKLIVVTTSGSGEQKMPGVDAISAASVMADLPTRLRQVESRLDSVLSGVTQDVPR